MTRAISVATRDFLINLIDGPRPIPSGHAQQAARCASTQAVLKGFARYLLERPGWIELTDRGRAVLAAALADWADAIVRAKEAAAEVRAANPPAARKSESAEQRLAALMASSAKPLKHRDNFF